MRTNFDKNDLKKSAEQVLEIFDALRPESLSLNFDLALKLLQNRHHQFKDQCLAFRAAVLNEAGYAGVRSLLQVNARPQTVFADTVRKQNLDNSLQVVGEAVVWFVVQWSSVLR